MADRLEINRTLVLCTSHITRMDAMFLNCVNNALVSYIMGDYGWLVYVGQEEGYAVTQKLEKFGYSEAFTSVIRLARQNDCSYIRFDPDGPEIEQLPVFDW